LLLPALTDVIEVLIPILDRMTAWAEANPGLVRSIALVVAGLFALRVTLLAGRFVLQTVIMAYWLFNGALAAVIWTAGALTSSVAFMMRALLWLARVAGGAATLALRLLAGAIRFVGRAFLWAGRLALANPLLAVLTAVAGIAYAIYDNWDGFAAYFLDKVDRVRAAFDTGLLNGVWAAIREFNPFSLALDGAIALARYIWDKLTAAFDIDLFDKGAAMIASLKEGIWSVLVGMVESIKAKLQSILPDWMVEGWNWVKGGEAGTTEAGSAPVGGRALGGPVRAGQVYRWMEEGDELFSPAVDGHVISNRELRSMRRVGDARQINLGGIVINAAPGQSPREIAREVLREVERKLTPAAPLHDGGDYVG
jgi:hypothetical protein